MAAEESAGRRNSNTQLLEELEALGQSHTSTTRRTASLPLPRASIETHDAINAAAKEERLNPKFRSRRMSVSPWRSRPKLDDENEKKGQAELPGKKDWSSSKFEDITASSERKGLWNWNPIWALSHIGMQKLSCLFSVEVVAVQGLPASMNGLRLSVCIRKKDTKDGAVHTMASRVSQGAADFEETLFIRCHVYCSPGSTGAQPKFEPRPFLIYVFAVDAKELDFGWTSVDLSLLIQQSIEKSHAGTIIRQWDMSFNLAGKAKGGELVLKLGFHVVEKDGGIGIYSQSGGQKSSKVRNLSSTARKQSKSSFSVPSPRMASKAVPWATSDFQGMDDLNLDKPARFHLPHLLFRNWKSQSQRWRILISQNLRLLTEELKFKTRKRQMKRNILTKCPSLMRLLRELCTIKSI